MASGLGRCVGGNVLVGKGGLEPPRSQEHMILSHARLPIPTLPHEV